MHLFLDLLVFYFEAQKRLFSRSESVGGREKDSDIRVVVARFQILPPLPFLWPASLASAGMRDEGDRGGEGCMAERMVLTSNCPAELCTAYIFERKVAWMLPVDWH